MGGGGAHNGLQPGIQRQPDEQGSGGDGLDQGHDDDGSGFVPPAAREGRYGEEDGRDLAQQHYQPSPGNHRTGKKQRSEPGLLGARGGAVGSEPTEHGPKWTTKRCPAERQTENIQPFGEREGREEVGLSEVKPLENGHV